MNSTRLCLLAVKLLTTSVVLFFMSVLFLGRLSVDHLHYPGDLFVPDVSVMKPNPPPNKLLSYGMNKKVTFRPASKDDIDRTLGMVKVLSLNEVRLERHLKEMIRDITLRKCGRSKIMLVSSWRSGSTFLGQLLSIQPGVFNHYEPLSYMGLRQVRTGPEAQEAVQLLGDLMNCSYTEGAYMNYLRKEYSDILVHNEKIWHLCRKGPNPSACFNTTFLQASCRYFPIQVTKLVRLRLNLTQFLLPDPGVKVVYLVRDPRGTMSSRLSSVKWCKKSAECYDPQYLCDDVESDLKFLNESKTLFPGRVYELKYETLAENPVETVKKLFKFLGMTFSRAVEKFVITNTQNDDNKPWSTRRQSKKRISLWKKKLNVSQIRQIEGNCNSVLKCLGYDTITCDSYSCDTPDSR